MTDNDQKYMVQTLATLLMTYKSKPSLKDCLDVSSGLHKKFPTLGDESSEVCDQMHILLVMVWYVFLEFLEMVHIYKKPKCQQEDDGPPSKRSKSDSLKKHEYPLIPSSANDEVSDERNMHLLKKEWSKASKSTGIVYTYTCYEKNGNLEYGLHRHH